LLTLRTRRYTYDGGIKTTKPANTALGKPKNIIDLGKTELPMEVIMEYLESLKEVYTFEVFVLQSSSNGVLLTG